MTLNTKSSFNGLIDVTTTSKLAQTKIHYSHTKYNIIFIYNNNRRSPDFESFCELLSTMSMDLYTVYDSNH